MRPDSSYGVDGLIVLVFGGFEKRIKNNTFLYNVSFLLFNKHIKITGFLDSGNTLYDTKTGKCVVVVSLQGIRKFLSEDMYEKFLSKNFFELGVSNELECVTVGGNKILIPIIDVGEIVVSQLSTDCPKSYKCVIGITNDKFAESDGYNCLLHREFL